MKRRNKIIGMIFVLCAVLLGCGLETARRKSPPSKRVSNKSSQPAGLDHSVGHHGWKTVYLFNGPVSTRMIGSSDWKSSSQSKQDEVIRKMLPLEPGQSRGRFFVDLAANDWQFLSNTYALETYEDWDGICIEPNDVYWKNHHKRKCALVGAGIGIRGEEVFFNFHNGGRGGIVGPGMDNKDKDKDSKKIHLTDLNDVFSVSKVPKIIDYFSLDIEGAETVAFKSIPFQTHIVYIFTIERPDESLRDGLRDRSYVEVGILGTFGDTMYLSNATPNFREVLKRGQESITMISKQISKISDADIGPVRRTGNLKKGDLVNHQYAFGVRCPYFELDSCGHELLPWDHPY
ncbi:predicted protein [Micromonas commoda]|uniref:Methyltransferase FkbM domain-containing protein n=1 Tax=Micromonas commoda (strain RCC299 / NOUM17 / CCMP2709) TaxID=296587 RepID=C1EJK7_MICCC|nr:predicted protein [Micromonas commoda]ACO68203.1 predicted protein [Micromonas commoda]|eukprot:XP_002506945.1 predicted protein [Micromonas commoda]